MLALTRKPEEEIVIADVITIKVIEVRGNKVRLGIDAPRSVAIDRREIWTRIQEEKALATRGSESAAQEQPEGTEQQRV